MMIYRFKGGMQMNYKGGLSKMWICEDCTFVFQLHSIRINLKKKPFCPSCGENFEVVAYSAKREPKSATKAWQRWQPAELEMANKCLMGERAPHQVAIELGRSLDSVKKCVERLRKESKLKGCK
jgi:transposase-like protein